MIQQPAIQRETSHYIPVLYTETGACLTGVQPQPFINGRYHAVVIVDRDEKDSDANRFLESRNITKGFFKARELFRAPDIVVVDGNRYSLVEYVFVEFRPVGADDAKPFLGFMQN